MLSSPDRVPFSACQFYPTMTSVILTCVRINWLVLMLWFETGPRCTAVFWVLQRRVLRRRLGRLGCAAHAVLVCPGGTVAGTICSTCFAMANNKLAYAYCVKSCVTSLCVTVVFFFCARANLLLAIAKQIFPFHWEHKCSLIGIKPQLSQT